MSARRRIFIALASGVAALAALPAGAAHAAPAPCTNLAPFAAGNFSNPTKIDNSFLPLVPGRQITMEGQANRGGGPLPHRIVFTVTDLTKVINGIRSVVVWDVDVNQGEVVESELAFWAQDDAGNVWNLGEYPEEYLTGSFLGAPSTWLAGFADAEGGVHMAAQPVVSNTFYSQGYVPSIQFFDCARVRRVNRRNCVPFACYENVLTTEEMSPLDPQGGSQIKYHAPGVGIIRVEAVNDPEGETLVMLDRSELTPDGLKTASQEALKLDARAYGVSDVYRQTPRAEGPPEPQPPPPPPPPPPAPEPEIVVAQEQRSAPARLTATAARTAVRRALRSRLRGWTVTSATCRLSGERRATCTFAARRRGFKLTGRGTVTVRASGGAVRYRLTSRIAKNGCRPVATRRCSRRTVWSR